MYMFIGADIEPNRIFRFSFLFFFAHVGQSHHEASFSPFNRFSSIFFLFMTRTRLCTNTNHLLCGGVVWHGAMRELVRSSHAMSVQFMITSTSFIVKRSTSTSGVFRIIRMKSILIIVKANSCSALSAGRIIERSDPKILVSRNSLVRSVQSFSGSTTNPCITHGLSCSISAMSWKILSIYLHILVRVTFKAGLLYEVSR